MTDGDTVGEIFGHPVARVIDHPEVRYRCQVCDLSGVDAVTFEQYGCGSPPPRADE